MGVWRNETGEYMEARKRSKTNCGNGKWRLSGCLTEKKYIYKWVKKM